MAASEHYFVEWKEQYVSKERGNRVVHYFLKDNSGESILAVVVSPKDDPISEVNAQKTHMPPHKVHFLLVHWSFSKESERSSFRHFMVRFSMGLKSSVSQEWDFNSDVCSKWIFFAASFEIEMAFDDKEM
ncbi:UNVERIFIED_CONTAM: hypothetical protein Scaly_1246700 [Sesamum calycinum]|uniref:Uncharacterized protein n=1 Tax=Sesamum calycinum TaxID=2727403 RepID=A0AAW2Q4T7_9LAMI